MSEVVYKEYPVEYPAYLDSLNQDNLPCDDGEPMETARHRQQMELLIHSLYDWLEARSDGFVGGNMFLHFSEARLRNRDFRGPDFFAVLGVPKGERKSWVIWEESKGPDVVIELLSESTATQDKTTKKAIYQDQLRVPEYFWYDPFQPDDWAGFKLSDGVYESLPLDEQERLYSSILDLALVRWQGSYMGVEATWLRWARPSGELLLTPNEAALQHADAAERRAEEQARRAEAAEAEVARLKALLAKHTASDG